MILFIQHSWNDKTRKMENRLVVSRVSDREQEEVGERRQEGWVRVWWASITKLCADGETAPWLQWWLLESTHVTKLHRTIHTCTKKLSVCKASDIWINSVDFTHAHLLVLTLHWSYTRCYHWWEIGWRVQRDPIHYFCNYNSIFQNKKLRGEKDR